jgi:hypothetical protein
MNNEMFYIRLRQPAGCLYVGGVEKLKRPADMAGLL